MGKLFVFLGICAFVLIALLIAGHEHMEKKKDNIKNPHYEDGLQDIKDHEDHINR